MNLTKLQSRQQFGEFLTREGVEGEGVEVGVAYGENAERILDQWSGRLTLVDPYIIQDRAVYRDETNCINMEACFEHARNRLAKFGSRVTFLRAFSRQAANEFRDGSLAFVYIDGNHSYAAVKSDIAAWHPKVRDGGIIGGHDFAHVDSPSDLCEVPKAVTEFCVANRSLLWLTDSYPENPSWWVLKH